jgi:hypothetical protein
MAWFGAKRHPARQFEKADPVVVEIFADLHEARHLQRNPEISPGAVQRFECKAWERLVDYLLKLPRLPSDD